jgi:hypothetical protein
MAGLFSYGSGVPGCTCYIAYASCIKATVETLLVRRSICAVARAVGRVKREHWRAIRIQSTEHNNNQSLALEGMSKEWCLCTADRQNSLVQPLGLRKATFRLQDNSSPALAKAAPPHQEYHRHGKPGQHVTQLLHIIKPTRMGSRHNSRRTQQS